MKLLVIGDIHLNHLVAEQIISHPEISYDKIIFLGDFFDHYQDSPELSAQTAEWVSFQLKKDNVVSLFSNHDLAYAYPTNRNLYCSGFDHEKCRAIFSKLDIHFFREKSKYFHREGDFIFSHAGVSRKLMDYLVRKGDIPSYEYSARDVEDKLDGIVPIVKSYNETGKIHSLVDVSYLRGGRAEVGGITWCDSNEIQPIPNVFQIFGHTPVYPETVAVRLNKVKDNIHFENANTYYPEKETRPVFHLTKNGCGIDIDSHLHGFAIVDPDAKMVEVYRLYFDFTIKQKYYGRKIERIQKVWEYKFL